MTTDKTIPREALQALEEAITVGLLVPRAKRVGAVIESLGPKSREALKHLKSNDIANIRYP